MASKQGNESASAADAGIEPLRPEPAWGGWFRQVGGWIRWMGPWRWGFFAVVLLGFGIRYAGLEYGMPYCYPWDEPEVMQPAIRVLRNNVYAPEKFDYGPLNTYIHAGWGALSFLRGNQRGEFDDGIWGLKSDYDTGWYWYVSSPYMWLQARLLSVLMGCVSVIFIGLATRVLAGRGAGLAAAGLAAVSGLAISMTQIIAPDAQALAAASVCLWASAHLLTSRAAWAYTAAAVSAAVMVSCKYNYATMVVAPVAAHVLSARREGAPLWNGAFARFWIWFAAVASACLLPVFLNPTKFLHDLSGVFRYYAPPEGYRPGLLAVAGGFGGKILATFDAGTFTGGDVVGSRTITNFDFFPKGIPAVLAALAGLVALARRGPRAMGMLLLVIAATLYIVGHDSTYFFSRYMLPMFPVCAVLAGAGVAATCRLLTARLPRTPAALAAAGVVLVVLGPIFFRSAQDARRRHNLVDPRNKLSAAMLEKLPEGTQITILAETRWHVTPAEARKFKISTATIPKLLHTPLPTTATQYLVTPVSLQFYTKTPIREQLQKEITRWLDALPAEMAFGHKDDAFFYGRPSIVPAVKLVRYTPQIAALAPRIPRDRIFGTAFSPISGAEGLTSLGDGALAIKPTVRVWAPVVLTKPATVLAIRAKSVTSLRYGAVPRISAEVAASTDTLSANPLARGDIPLERISAGMVEYRAGVKLAPGQYRVTLRPTDPSGLMVLVDSVEFF